VDGQVLAQCSAHGEAVGGVVRAGSGGTARIRWAEPRRRVAPGQSVVLYRGDVVLGGGVVAA
jgi:tRNA-specific 2-thiouridylase